MTGMRLGAHTYVFSEFGYDQAAQLDEIWDMVARCGFAAIEMHAPMFDRADWYEAMMAASERTGMAIVGGSNGGALWDEAAWGGVLRTMEAYTAKLSRLDSPKCGFTSAGKPLAERTDAENAQVVRGWTELAQLCQSRGVELNYHTHGEPLEDIQFVIDNTPADLLPLGPDLDWLRFGGTDPVTFLRANAERLVMLHVRDYKLGGQRTNALGEGDADYAELKTVLEEIGFGGDFVVELAVTPGAMPDRPLEELLRVSREHVRATVGI